MKRVRIGCGSGGCSYERLEPTEELLQEGELDYLVFECLAERTIAEAQQEKLREPERGYNPQLEIRMRRFLKLAVEKGVKIVSNMGAANTPKAVEKICQIARELGLQGLKIGMVQGDDIMHCLDRYAENPLWDRKAPLKTLKNIVSANAYLSGDPICEALDHGADIVITGRVADPSLFVGPLKHEFGWKSSQPHLMGQAVLLGHLLECCAQITGGFYADPGHKDVEGLERTGFPIAEMDETGDFFVTKVEGAGGTVCESNCREQLLYEIGDPGHYITPDAIADFSHVTFTTLGKDKVLVQNASSKGEPLDYKVNIGYSDCYIGEASISYGGSNALARAQLCADIVEKRLKIVGVKPDELRVDFIGYDSLYRDFISREISPSVCHEIRLRVCARTQTYEDAVAVVREIQCMYTNGPAGSSGIDYDIRKVLSVENILVPRKDIPWTVSYCEV